MPKILHYRENCIGCNSCREHDPELWKISEKDGKADLEGSKLKRNVYVVEIREDQAEKNKIAAKDCPARVIKILD